MWFWYFMLVVVMLILSAMIAFNPVHSIFSIT